MERGARDGRLGFAREGIIGGRTAGGAVERDGGMGREYGRRGDAGCRTAGVGWWW